MIRFFLPPSPLSSLFLAPDNFYLQCTSLYFYHIYLSIHLESFPFRFYHYTAPIYLPLSLVTCEFALLEESSWPTMMMLIMIFSQIHKVIVFSFLLKSSIFLYVLYSYHSRPSLIFLLHFIVRFAASHCIRMFHNNNTHISNNQKANYALTLVSQQ